MGYDQIFIKKVFVVIFFLTIFSFCHGCLFHQQKPSPTALDKSMPAIEQSIKVVDESRLRQGGALLVIPLTAGVGVSATSELERTSLMFVKGIHETLESTDIPVNVISEDISKADFVIKGHVLNFQQAQRRQYRFWKKGVTALGFEGRMIDNKTKHDIILFSLRVESSEMDVDTKNLGYELGKSLANAIIEKFR